MIARGASEEEVKNVLLFGMDIPARRDRKAKEMVLSYGEEWLGRIYPQRKVMVIYVEEGEEAVIITVKVFYGQWR